MLLHQGGELLKLGVNDRSGPFQEGTESLFFLSGIVDHPFDVIERLKHITKAVAFDRGLEKGGHIECHLMPPASQLLGHGQIGKHITLRATCH